MVTSPNEQLTPYLFEITTGILLGDGNLQKPKSCRYHRLRFAQNQKRQDYVDWLFQQYKNEEYLLTASKKRLIAKNHPSEFSYITPTNKKIEKGYSFQTRISSAFNTHAEIFYAENSTKKRLCLELDIFDDLLTPTALAFWFMDDGTWPNKNSRSFLLCTHGFTVAQVNYFAILLNKKFGLITTVRLNKGQPVISISAKCFQKFENLILPYIQLIPSMAKKFPIT